MCGYYDREKIAVNLGCKHETLLVRLFFKKKGNECGKGDGLGFHSPLQISIY